MIAAIDKYCQKAGRAEYESTGERKPRNLPSLLLPSDSFGGKLKRRKLVGWLTVS